MLVLYLQISFLICFAICVHFTYIFRIVVIVRAYHMCVFLHCFRIVDVILSHKMVVVCMQGYTHTITPECIQFCVYNSIFFLFMCGFMLQPGSKFVQTILDNRHNMCVHVQCVAYKDAR